MQTEKALTFLSRLFIRVNRISGQANVLSCRPQVSGGHLQAEKSPDLSVEALCSHSLPFRVGQALSLRKNMPVACFSKKKPPTFVGGFLCSRYLSSRAVTRQVLSAYMCLTSVFGMGTGGPTWQSTRTIQDIPWKLNTVSYFCITQDIHWACALVKLSAY